MSRKRRNQLLADHPDLWSLAPGEKDLLAHLHARGKVLAPWMALSSADKGAIVAVGKLGWLDRLISLEELLLQAGASRQKIAVLDAQHSADFLARVRTKVLLGVIP